MGQSTASVAGERTLARGGTSEWLVWDPEPRQGEQCRECPRGTLSAPPKNAPEAKRPAPLTAESRSTPGRYSQRLDRAGCARCAPNIYPLAVTGRCGLALDRELIHGRQPRSIHLLEQTPHCLKMVDHARECALDRL